MEKVIEVNRLNLKSLLDNMGSRVYSVTFTKADKSTRRIETRNSVTSGVKGTGSALKLTTTSIRRVDLQLMSKAGVLAKAEGREVTDQEKRQCWRSISLARTTEVRGAGNIYKIVD